MASEEDNQHNDVVAIELPAPAGWSKKFTPKKGGTPQRNDIVFISPTGEEIKSKKQLDQYLKSHPGGPAASEFEWGTGDTPRRSARLSEKSKAEVAPTSPSPKKKQKRSSTKQPQEKNSADVVEEEATDEKDATAEETEGTLDSATVDAKEATDKDVIIPEKPGNENVEKKTYTEEPGIVTSVEPDAKMEESKETSSVEPSAQAEELMVESSQPEVKNEEAKEVTNGGGEEAPAGKVDSAVTEGVENSKEKEEAEEKAVEKKEEVLLQEPTTGS